MVITNMTSRQVTNRKYQTSPKGRIAHNRAKATFALNHPEVGKAMSKVNNTIRTGGLVRVSDLNCHFCSNPAEQYHHENGYEAPHQLDVIPVCCSCHRILTFSASRIAKIFADTVGFYNAHRVRNGRNVYQQDRTVVCNPRRGVKTSYRGSGNGLAEPVIDSPRISPTGKRANICNTAASLGTMLPTLKSEEAVCKGKKRHSIHRKLGCEIPKNLFECLEYAH